MILVALGSYLPGPAGPPEAQVAAALEMLGRRAIAVLRRSRYWRSPAWPDPAEPAFVNAVAVVATVLSPRALLAELHAVEAALGRVRGRPNAPRTLDLDLLDYDGRILPGGDGAPALPHPRMTTRAFVLLPLADVAPDWRHPVSGVGLATLVAALGPDHGTVPLGEAEASPG